VGNTWYALTPQGKKATAQAPAAGGDYSNGYNY
jgi:hypothetical protein